MSLYFFLLAVMPCGDAAAHNNEACDQTACVHPDAEDSGHSESDACSPLCMCSCCGGITILLSAHVSPEQPIIHSSQNTTFTQQLTAGISCSVWQPPRLG